jgi:hypothetical protein
VREIDFTGGIEFPNALKYTLETGYKKSSREPKRWRVEDEPA